MFGKREEEQPTFDPSTLEPVVKLVTKTIYDEHTGEPQEIEVEDLVQPSPPKKITKTGKRNDVLYVAGKGREDADVMFVQTSLFEDEAKFNSYISKYGARIKENPEHLNGPQGEIIKNCCHRAQIDIRECYYTSLCKWLLPKSFRNRPNAAQLEWAN
jgi:hypothetical protein